MPRIVIASGPRKGEAIRIEHGLCVGREDGCQIVLGDAKVSRRHARFESKDGDWILVDLGSSHGTYVNRERVTSRTLADGDHVQLGDTLLRFHAEGEVSEVVRELPTIANTDGSPPGADAKLRLFYDLARAVADLSDTESLLRGLLRGVVDVLGAERGAVGLCEPGGLHTVVYARPGSEESVTFARDVHTAVLSRQSAIIVREPETSQTLARQRVRSAMAAPVCASGRVLGILYVDDRGKVNRFGDADLEWMVALGRLCAAVLSSAERFQSADAVAEALRPGSPLAALEGDSAAVERLRLTLRNVAAADAHVVIHGESGTGKELVARALHALSPRAEQPFVALSCAALHEQSVESELFGHTSGAFTGADKSRRGAFVLAHRGTLFLDEIGEISPATQSKVLRAIQEREVQPLGAERPTRVDVRIFAASHKDLWREVEAGRFREDLYYRLHVVDVQVPPLRDRAGDIALLAKRFLLRSARRLEKALVGFSTEALEALEAHSWPGNVRELQNEAERAAIVASGPLVEVWDLSARIRGAPVSLRPTAVRSSAPPQAVATPAERFAALEPTERALVQEALTTAKGNLAEAARILGITRIMLKRRAERFGLRSDRDE
ncbi:MAG: sigma 54-interacting transcriptional regulator [Polyangiaceae bacterium]|nr:sigma 54-interacting transcriptional regulator [Polyangiaceae bacterium]